MMNNGERDSEIPGEIAPAMLDDEIMDVQSNPAILRAVYSVLEDLKELSPVEQEERILATPPEDVALFLSEWSPVELCAMYAHRIRRVTGMDTPGIEVLVQKLLDAKKYGEAKIPAKMLMERRNYVGYTAFAKILNQEGKSEMAIHALRSGLDEGVKFPPRQYVSILIACGLYKEALAESIDLLKEEPSLAFSIFYCYDRLGQKEKTAEAFRKAIEINHLGESIAVIRNMIKEENDVEAKKLLVRIFKNYMGGYHIPDERIEQMGERISGLFFIIR